MVPHRFGNAEGQNDQQGDPCTSRSIRKSSSRPSPNVRFDFAKVGAGTKLVLDHTGFPKSNRDHLEDGWHKMYWEPLKAYLS
jgi:hypothetical protein